jgi:hypothetical protein
MTIDLLTITAIGGAEFTAADRFHQSIWIN